MLKLTAWQELCKLQDFAAVSFSDNIIAMCEVTKNMNFNMF